MPQSKNLKGPEDSSAPASLEVYLREIVRSALAPELEVMAAEIQELAHFIRTSQSVPARTPIGNVDAARLLEAQPKFVRLLLVSTPSLKIESEQFQFYLTNSHSFRCIRGAFVRAFGGDVPHGDEFLEFLESRGCWFVSLPSELQRGRGRPPTGVIDEGTEFLVEILRKFGPEIVVGLERRVRGQLADAVEQSQIPTRLHLVNTPRATWRAPILNLLRGVFKEPGGTPHDSLDRGSVKTPNSPARSRLSSKRESTKPRE